MLNNKEMASLKGHYRIILADPCPIIRYGLRQAIHLAPWQIEQISETGQLSIIPKLIPQYWPNILIIELMGNGDSVLDALRIINHCIRYWPHISIVVCTTLHHIPLFQLLRAMNVSGIYLKQEPLDTLLQCIEKALHGSRKFSPMVSHSLQKMEQVTHIPLTEKELEVIVLLLTGKNVTTIAKLMHRDIRTVSTHKRSAMRKIGFKNDSEIFSNSQWMTLHNQTYSSPLSQKEDYYGK